MARSALRRTPKFFLNGHLTLPSLGLLSRCPAPRREPKAPARFSNWPSRRCRFTAVYSMVLLTLAACDSPTPTSANQNSPPATVIGPPGQGEPTGSELLPATVGPYDDLDIRVVVGGTSFKVPNAYWAYYARPRSQDENVSFFVVNAYWEDGRLQPQTLARDMESRTAEGFRAGRRPVRIEVQALQHVGPRPPRPADTRLRSMIYGGRWKGPSEIPGTGLTAYRLFQRRNSKLLVETAYALQDPTDFDPDGMIPVMSCTEPEGECYQSLKPLYEGVGFSYSFSSRYALQWRDLHHAVLQLIERFRQ